MQIIKKIKDDLYQIFAVTEKDLKLSTRFKLPIIMSFITPILNLLLPLIILGQIFTFSDNFGLWDSQNFALYIMTSYQISIMTKVRNIFPSRFYIEKVWKTLHATIIAPFNRRNLLLGMFGADGVIEWDWNTKQVGVFNPKNQEWKYFKEDIGTAQEGYNPNIIEEMYIDEMKHFLNAVKGKEKYHYTLEDDEKVLDILYKIEESHQKQTKIDL